MKIFINPGHDPQLDPGACGNGLREADVVLKIGRREKHTARGVYSISAREFVARAIASGVTDYFQNEKPLPDVVDTPKKTSSSDRFSEHFAKSEFVCHCCGRGAEVGGVPNSQHVKGLHLEDLRDFQKVFVDASIDAFF